MQDCSPDGSKQRTKILFLLVAAGVLIALVAGCGSSSSSTSTGGSGGGETSGSGETGGTASASLASFEAELEELYAGKDYTDPPAESPPPAKGKDVWLISCGEQITSCQRWSESGKEAAEAMGWTVNVFDGKGEPAVYGQGLRQAISAGADGIITYGIDCPLVRQQLVEAKQADIPTVTVESLDCDEKVPSGAKEPGQPQLYDWTVTYGEGTSFVDYFKEWTAASAVWAIATQGGKANIIEIFDPEFAVLQISRVGLEEEVAKCAECELSRVEFTAAELGPKLQQKVEQALLKDPNANAVEAAADGFMTAGVTAGITASGRASEVLGVGGEGLPPNIELVRKGNSGQNGGTGLPSEWESFSAVDSLNRLFAGEEPQPSGIGLQVYDQEHNLPPEGEGYLPPKQFRDFKQKYEEAWGVK